MAWSLVSLPKSCCRASFSYSSSTSLGYSRWSGRSPLEIACLIRGNNCQRTALSLARAARDKELFVCEQGALDRDIDVGALLGRRELWRILAGDLGLWLVAANLAGSACAAPFTDMPALRGKDYGKTKMKYPDYTETESGLQYKDLRTGTGAVPQAGDTVVVDWDGYTIGYYGRIFEARNKAKGGSFEGNEKDFFRFTLGWNEVIPAFEEAVATMHVGGVRRIVVPPELGYPDNDFGKKGPKPTTFSGQRALDFVLRNQGLIDKTLLFDIELLKVARS